MKNCFGVLALLLCSVILVGCGDGTPSDVKPVKAESTGAPAVEKDVKKVPNPGTDARSRGEAALQSKINRGSQGARGGAK